MPIPVRGPIGLVSYGMLLILWGLFLIFDAKWLANRPYSGMRSFWSGFYRQTETEIRRSGWKSLGAGILCMLIGFLLGVYFGF